MATYGKISSSLLNFSTTTTAIDNPVASTLPGSSEKQLVTQRNAPSLNLGLFQSTAYVLTPMGRDSTNPIDTLFGNYSFGNNITLVTPNVKPSQPNNAVPSERVARYAGSFMDQTRGMHGSIIIGHDIGTVGFPAGSDENTAGYQGAARGYFSAPNIVMGSFILEGCGSQPAAVGYASGKLASNTIIGNGFGSCILDSNLDYYNATGGYGYGSIIRAEDNSILGHNNYAYSFRPSSSRASVIAGNTIVGHNNGVSDRYQNNYGYFVGYGKSPIITERKNGSGYAITPFRIRAQRNHLFGNQNFSYTFSWRGANKATNPEFTPIVQEEDNVMIGTSNQSDQMLNYDYTGGDIQGYVAASFDNNICIGRGNALKKYFEEAGYSPTMNNIILGRNNQLHFEHKQNIIMGLDWKFFAGFSAGAKASGDRNIFFGEPGFDKYYGPAGGVGASNSDNNICIGFDINSSLLGSELQHQNVTLIGYQASASATNATNEITLGNSSISALRCNVTSITSLSDARDKANIEPISNASAFIKDLKPVKFDWNRRDGVKAKEHDIGFLAQDLDEAQSKHGIQEHLDIVYKSNPEALEASYGKLLPILVQALKEQQEEIEKLKSTN